MSSDIAFTKENLDRYLKELAKEFRRRNGKTMPAEIILIGGASILANYGFREATYDMDAIIQASSAMKEAINHVGDLLGLPNGWLNTDFVKTKSYSPKLITYSKYYKTFSNILTIRTIAAEYLIAMKLMSGRKYKYDLSDIVGILLEHENCGHPLTLKQVESAVSNLYGGMDKLPADSTAFIQAVMKNGEYAALYQQYRKEEQSSKKSLLEFEVQYPGVTTDGNINDILETLKSKRHKGP